MTDLLAALLGNDHAADAHARVRASLRPPSPGLIKRAEEAVVADPGAVTLDDDGAATVVVDGRRWGGGRFTLPTIGQLRAAAVGGAAAGAPAPTLTVLEGGGDATDIGALQAMAASDTLFQVASQFNCLESPGPHLARVADYLSDNTQGPRASISAFPGTLVRHYAAPDGAGGRFTQEPARQVDLLADALPPEVGRVVSGYLRPGDLLDPAGAAVALTDRFDRIRVGVHEEVEVALGAQWWGAVAGRPHVTQVFTSTLAAGRYGGGARITGALEATSRALLRAAYLGTLLAAPLAGRSRVVLTMIGGGVFKNPHMLILECLLWALDEVALLDTGPLEVILNARQLESAVDRDWLAGECARRGGAVRNLESGFRPR